MIKKNTKYLLGVVFLLLSQSAVAQFTVEGTVIDAQSGQALVGVNIYDPGSEQGTTTNTEGFFSLEIPAQSATLRITYVGYNQKNVEVSADNNEITIELQKSVANLDEVVVTGLASSVQRENLANAVSSVDSEQLTGTTSSQTLSSSLYGKVAGANITSNTGAPGGGMSVKLRGVTTINGSSEPLYIIDGIYLNNDAIANGSNAVTQAAAGGSSSNQDNPVNRVADLNPDEIQSIEVLKGASAAAIYGQRASGGVVIITTKRGSGGKAQFSASQSIGLTTIQKKLGQRQFTEATAESAFGPKGKALFNEAKSSNRFLDYEELMYGQEGVLSKTQISSSFGNESTSFYVSGMLQNDEGIIKTTGYEKQSIRANVDHQFTEKFNVSVSSNYIHSESRRGLTGNDNTGTTFGVSMVATPNFIDLRPENGVYPAHPFNTANQLQTRDLFSNSENVNRVLTSVKAEYDIFQKDGNYLALQFQGGVDFFSQNNKLIFPSDLQFERISAQPGTLVETNTNNLNTNTSLMLIHTFSLSENATLVSQGGYTSFNNDQNTISTVGRGILGTQTNVDQTVSVSNNQTRIYQRDRGFFIQEEFNYNDTYITTVGLRGDKSDRNGNVNEIFYYPKASFAWNISNMDFWEGNGPIDNLKLRTAYGQTGNLSTFGAKFTSLGPSNIGGSGGILITNTRGTDDIQPERQKELEAGFDISAWGGTANLSVTVYQKNISELLLQRELEPSTGFSFESFNGGGLRNRGIEASLDLTPVRNNNLNWNSTFTFSKNVSEVTDLSVPAFDVGGFGTSLGVYRVEEGKSATQIVGLDPVKDSNGNFSGDITTKKLGDGEPNFQLSWYNQLNILKNVDFSFMLHWKKGGDVINLTELLSDLNGTTADYDDTDLTFPDFVNEAGGITDDTKNGVKRASLLGVTTRQFVQDGSYLRMREIGLYYNVPTQMIEGISSALRGIRFGVSATNLFTISPYRSYDPEVSNFGNQPIAQGIEVTPYPSTKQYYFHFNIDF
ncbi:SusC/RagA family TonB-linked outer membrane protein [Aliifodinibius salipaludis]|uniref:SusC/RagA family TonB-linked outer membrane protein n=1 Tax=Fodinibius salipaludis TaxID=2032627 RepID=A0A2A2GBF6_9BACT|nr:SusC/RagA family TonB-linked outer membrane protein [Aliifodinibius salipaludis]PAU94207.1 SusC/RagA family TonB-linked outer membrane protein [Aliifodinibius salipaludis]